MHLQHTIKSLGRCVLCAGLLAATQATAATGDILGAEIETNGWVLRLWIEGYATNSAFSWGWSSTNNFGESKLAVTGNALGFDDAGNVIGVFSRLVGTRSLRYAYNVVGQAAAYVQDAIIEGSAVKLRVALSDYVFSDWTNLTVHVQSGLYSNNAAYVGPITNSSLAIAPRPVGNWAWPGWERITANTYTGRVVAFHRSAQQGRPVRAVCMVASDQHSNYATNWVTTPTIDRGMPDAVPVIEYIGILSLATMTAGDDLRLDFVAYPWIGTTPLSTFDNVFAWPTPNYHALTCVYDPSNAYPVSYALVSITNSGTGQVFQGWTNGAEPVAFSTIAAAANAISKSNGLWYGATHSNAAAGQIYLREGDYIFTGGAVNPTERGRTWVTLEAHPLADPGLIRITNGTSGGNDINDLVRFNRLKFEAPNAWPYALRYVTNVWFDRCIILPGTTVGPPVNSCQLVAYTHCTSTNIYRLFSESAADNVNVMLARGNVVQDYDADLYPFMLIGNRFVHSTKTNTQQLLCDSLTARACQVNDGAVVAFNRLTASMGVGIAPMMRVGDSVNKTNGWAIVQNVLEHAISNAQPMVDICADGGTATTVYNMLILQNTTTGQRWNYGYNDTTTTRRTDFWTVRGNTIQDWCVKSDTFLTSSAASTGNWNVVYGVGVSCNGNSDLGTFNPETLDGSYPLYGFPGRRYAVYVNADFYLHAPWHKYVDDRGAWLDTTGAGNGDYHLLPDSPNRYLQMDEWILPFDIEGNPRGACDPPGAYSPTPKRGNSLLCF